MGKSKRSKNMYLIHDRLFHEMKERTDNLKKQIRERDDQSQTRKHLFIEVITRPSHPIPRKNCISVSLETSTTTIRPSPQLRSLTIIQLEGPKMSWGNQPKQEGSSSRNYSRKLSSVQVRAKKSLNQKTMEIIITSSCEGSQFITQERQSNLRRISTCRNSSRGSRTVAQVR